MIRTLGAIGDSLHCVLGGWCEMGVDLFLELGTFDTSLLPNHVRLCNGHTLVHTFLSMRALRERIPNGRKSIS